MDDNERWFAAKTLLLKIHAITGWTIPVSEMMDILIDQFQKKLIEGYAKVTVAEMEYAFRNKGLDIKDWGKSLNLTMMDEVILPYLEQRFELSRMEESLKEKPMIEEKKELSDEEISEWIMEWVYKEPLQMELIPLLFYDFLDRKKILEITVQQKWEYTEKAKNGIKVQLQTDVGICKTNDAYLAINKFENMEINGFTGEMKESILNRAKKLIVYDYLLAQKQTDV